MNFRGVIIEESLQDKSVLKDVVILGTKIEPATDDHNTPWLNQWTLQTIEFPEHRAEQIAEKLSSAIDSLHPGSWYADFKNDMSHYIVFKNRVFKIDLQNPTYRSAMEHGTTIGIPPHQPDFAPEIEQWKRD